MDSDTKFEERLQQRGISRRQFLKYCSVVAGALGLGPSFGPQVFEAFGLSSKSVRGMIFSLASFLALSFFFLSPLALVE